MMNRYVVSISLGMCCILTTAMATSWVSGLSRGLSADDDDFEVNYSNPNDHYEPNEYVKYGHMMSRNDEFEATQDYAKNAAYMPAVLFALGILSFLIINLFLFFRCCCTCIACLPDEKAEKYHGTRWNVLLSFYFVIFVCLGINQLMFLGNYHIGEAVSTFQVSIDSVESLVNNVIADADTMVSLSNEMLVTVNLVSGDIKTCKYLNGSSDVVDYFSSANSSVYDFQSQASSILDKTDKVDGVFDDLDEKVELYGNDYRFKIICGIWILPMLVVLLLLSTHCCRSKLAMQCSVFLVWLVFILFLVIGAFWGLFVTETSTFCMEPIYNLNKAVPEGSRNLTMYYTACQGEGLLGSLVNETISQISELQEALTNMTNAAVENNITTYCPGTQFLVDIDSLQVELNSVVSTINDVNSITGCGKVQPIMFSLINDVLCTELYTGIFFLWGSQLFTSFMLFIVILVASYVWQYYKFWNVDTNGRNEFDGSDEGDGNEDEEEEEEDHFLTKEKTLTEFGGGGGGSASRTDYDQIASGPASGELEMTEVSERESTTAAGRKGPKKVKNRQTVANSTEDDEAMI